METAARYYRIGVSPTREQRQIYGKVPELALGFGGAVGALMRMAANYQVDMSEELALTIVGRWRKANAWAPTYWRRAESRCDARRL